MASESEEKVLSLENAEKSLQELLDFYDLDPTIDDAGSEEATKGLRNAKGKLTRAISKGLVKIDVSNGECTVVQTMKNPSKFIKDKGGKLTYRTIDGASKIAMKEADPNDTYGTIYCLMGALCGVPAAQFIEIKAPDLGVTEALGVLFLGS
jgi:hypothetical protein